MKREHKPCLLCRVSNIAQQFSKDKRASSLSLFRTSVASLEDAMAVDSHYFDKQYCEHGAMHDDKVFAEVVVRIAQAATEQRPVTPIGAYRL